MCLITGFVNFSDSIKKTLNVLKNLEHRGLDGNGVYFNGEVFLGEDLVDLKDKLSLIDDTDRLKSSEDDFSRQNIIFGHSLHAIVGFNLQPFEKNGNILICNCEIYNWMELKEKYNLDSKNDAQLILDLIELKGYENIKYIINEFGGPFAFAYYNKSDNKIVLARDIIGEKPLFYFFDKEKKQFAFCSEKKGIVDLKNICELNPREILTYDLTSNEINFEKNELNYTGKFFSKDYSILKKETLELLEKSIMKMVPFGQKLGLLFSGGIDSTFIAYILAKNNVDFTCYTAKLEGGNIEEAPDYIYAKEIAKKYGFKLKVSKVKIENLESEVREVIGLIEEREYIKVSVALPFLLSTKLAKKDGVKVILSGLGSEELFAGYRRHKQCEDPNLECYKGFLTLHYRDLYRDDVICMSQNQEIRLPFLDTNLINYALQIPVKYKLNLDTNRSKIILRDIAKDIGLDEKYCERAKKAAQYGSKFDKGLLRLAKNSKLGKQEYLDLFN